MVGVKWASTLEPYYYYYYDPTVQLQPHIRIFKNKWQETLFLLALEGKKIL